MLFARAIRKYFAKAEYRRAVRLGLIVGDGSKFVGMQKFGSEPFLIRIGCECLITDGVEFVNHDGAIQVPLIRDRAGTLAEIYGRQSMFDTIEIGDNCFIGQGALLLPGTRIGSNSIVGARALVSGEFPPCSVIAGTPARLVCHVDEYFERNKRRIVKFPQKTSRNERNAIIVASIRAHRSDPQ